MNTPRQRLLIASRVLVFILAFSALLYALNLLIVGQQVVGIQEGSTEAYVSYAPAPAAIWPLIASLLLIVGMLVRQKIIIWIAWMALALFSFLFLFSIGGVLIPVSAALVLLLIVIQIMGTSNGSNG